MEAGMAGAERAVQVVGCEAWRLRGGWPGPSVHGGLWLSLWLKWKTGREEGQDLTGVWWVLAACVGVGGKCGKQEASEEARPETLVPGQCSSRGGGAVVKWLGSGSFQGRANNICC